MHWDPEVLTAGLSELEAFTYLLTIPPPPRKSQFLIMQQSPLVTLVCQPQAQKLCWWVFF